MDMVLSTKIIHFGVCQQKPYGGVHSTKRSLTRRSFGIASFLGGGRGLKWFGEVNEG